MIKRVYFYSRRTPIGQQRLHPVSIKEYDILVQLHKGTYKKKVSERTAEEKNAIVHYYRLKPHIQIKYIEGKDILFYRGEKVLTKRDCKKKITEQIHKHYGYGARCVRKTLKGKYTCFGERQIIKCIQEDKVISKSNARFTNKPPLKSVSANHVFDKVQVDLISMKDDAVEYEGKKYRYILSVIDILSRFTICKPLVNKTASEVAKAMQETILEHGCPRTVQCDNGTEFKGKFEALLRRHHIKLIHGRPYHPESQGKVERNNALIKKKLRFLRSKERGANWVKDLRKVCYAINSTRRQSIGYLRPLDVYFGRSEDSVDRMRTKAKEASDKSAQSTNFYKGRTCSKYYIRENVLIKYPFSKSRLPQKQKVLDGVIIKRHESLVKYDVAFVDPETNEERTATIPVENITSVTRAKEDQRPKLTSRNFSKKVKKAMHRKRFYIILKQTEPEEQAHHDVSGSPQHSDSDSTIVEEPQAPGTDENISVHTDTESDNSTRNSDTGHQSSDEENSSVEENEPEEQVHDVSGSPQHSDSDSTIVEEPQAPNTDENLSVHTDSGNSTRNSDTGHQSSDEENSSLEENEPEEQVHDSSGSPQHSDSDSTILEEPKASDTDENLSVHTDSGNSTRNSDTGHQSSDEENSSLEENEPEEQVHDSSGSPQHSDSDSTILEEPKASDTDENLSVHTDSGNSTRNSDTGHQSSDEENSSLEENEPEEQVHDSSGSPQHSDSDSTIVEEHQGSDTDGHRHVITDSESDDFETVIGLSSDEENIGANDFPSSIEIIYDPLKYGDCQFDAVAHQLHEININRSGEQLRHEAVKYLFSNRHFFGHFFQNIQEFHNYLKRMKRPSTYGDHFTLQALSKIFNVQFLICSVRGPDHNNLISDTGVYSPNLPLLTLGYYPEEEGEHYCSVRVQPEALPGIIDGLYNRPHRSEESTESECNQQNSSYPTLPPEILTIIVKETALKYPLEKFNLMKVNRLFRTTVERLGLPAVYINPSILYPVPRPVSVRFLIRNFGSGSGLILSIKEIIAQRGWTNAWLFLQEKENFWYEIRNIKWKT